MGIDTNVKDCIRSEALHELVIASGSDGDDLVARELGELDSELTDAGTSSVDEDPRFVCPFGRRRVEAFGEP